MVLRRRPKANTDPFSSLDPSSVPVRYRARVTAALDVRRRFRELTADLGSGPVAERIAAMGPRLDAGVQGIWKTVERAARAQRAVEQLNPDTVAAEYKAARRAALDGSADEAYVAAVAARFNSTQRLLNSLDDVDRSLSMIEARIGAIVARAAELSVLGAVADGPADADRLAAELDGVLLELEALDAGIRDVAAIG